MVRYKILKHKYNKFNTRTTMHLRCPSTAGGDVTTSKCLRE
jgi:hypothetical protein